MYIKKLTSSKREIFTMYLSAFTIGLPYTIFGLLVLVFAKIIYADHAPISIVAGRLRVSIRRFRHVGVSLGIVYIMGHVHDLSIEKHELGHTIQFKRFGALFILLVAIPSVTRFWFRRITKIRKRPYEAIWFEGQATRLGEEKFSYL